MSRKIFTVLAGLLLLVGGAACGSDSSTDNNSTNAEFVADCSTAMGLIDSGLTTISEGVDYIPVSDAATVREFLSTSRAFVQTSIETVSRCSSINPAAASRVLLSLNELDDTIAEVQRSY